jgi:hypothetical protein
MDIGGVAYVAVVMGSNCILTNSDGIIIGDNKAAVESEAELTCECHNEVRDDLKLWRPMEWELRSVRLVNHERRHSEEEGK